MKILIPRLVYDKVMYWVNKADFEVSGFGKVTYNIETDEYTVTDAFLLKQEGGAAHTDIDPESLGRLMYESKDAPGDLNWWWHSHVRMQAFWSGTDKETIKKIGMRGYCVATVFNQMHQTQSAYYGMFTGPNGEKLPFEQWEAGIQILETPGSVPPEWDQQFETHVTKKVWGSKSNVRALLDGSDILEGAHWNGTECTVYRNGKIYEQYSYKAGQKIYTIEPGQNFTKKELKKLKKQEVSEEEALGVNRWGDFDTYTGYSIYYEAMLADMSTDEVQAIYDSEDAHAMMNFTNKLEAALREDSFGNRS